MKEVKTDVEKAEQKIKENSEKYKQKVKDTATEEIKKL